MEPTALQSTVLRPLESASSAHNWRVARLEFVLLFPQREQPESLATPSGPSFERALPWPTYSPILPWSSDVLSGLYSAAAGIRVAEANQEVTAHNLSHVDTPGFRRVMSSIYAVPVQQPAAADPLDVSTAEIEVNTRTRDFQPGAMIQTQRPLDVALNGDGFFAVTGPDGTLYTRNGVFQMTADGQLVTNGGYAVQGENGPLIFPPGTSPAQVTIARDGTVFAGDQQIDQLRIVAFDDPHKLAAASDTLFAQGSAELTASEATVEQGYHEHSNVVATEELVQMIVGLRLHEASQRALRSLSDAVRQHVNVDGGQ